MQIYPLFFLDNVVALTVSLKLFIVQMCILFVISIFRRVLHVIVINRWGPFFFAVLLPTDWHRRYLLQIVSSISTSLINAQRGEGFANTYYRAQANIHRPRAEKQVNANDVRTILRTLRVLTISSCETLWQSVIKMHATISRNISKSLSYLLEHALFFWHLYIFAR